MASQPTSIFIRLAPLSLLLALAALATPARSQELSASLGTSHYDAQNSYSWSLDYRQRSGRYLAWSFMWMNEGHFAGHHRDGFAGQIWGVLPLHNNRLTLALGAGLYRYFDTQYTNNGTSSTDAHGFTAIYGATLTWYATPTLFINAALHRTSLGGDAIDTTTFRLGIGAWLGPVNNSPFRPQPPSSFTPEPASPNPYAHRHELTAFAGLSIVNTFSSESAFAQALEYRYQVSKHTDWTLTFLNEGSTDVLKRNGLATQLWLAGRFFKERLQLSIGFGVYWTFESTTEVEGTNAISGIVSPSVSWQFSHNLLARLTWNRVVCNYDRDSDVLLLGLSYAWGSPPSK